MDERRIRLLAAATAHIECAKDALDRAHETLKTIGLPYASTRAREDVSMLHAAIHTELLEEMVK